MTLVPHGRDQSDDVPPAPAAADQVPGASTRLAFDVSCRGVNLRPEDAFGTSLIRAGCFTASTYRGFPKLRAKINARYGAVRLFRHLPDHRYRHPPTTGSSPISLLHSTSTPAGAQPATTEGRRRAIVAGIRSAFLVRRVDNFCPRSVQPGDQAGRLWDAQPRTCPGASDAGYGAFARILHQAGRYGRLIKHFMANGHLMPRGGGCLDVVS